MCAEFFNIREIKIRSYRDQYFFADQKCLLISLHTDQHTQRKQKTSYVVGAIYLEKMAKFFTEE